MATYRVTVKNPGQPHHRYQPVTVEATTASHARDVAEAELGGFFEAGAATMVGPWQDEHVLSDRYRLPLVHTGGGCFVVEIPLGGRWHLWLTDNEQADPGVAVVLYQTVDEDQPDPEYLTSCPEWADDFCDYEAWKVLAEAATETEVEQLVAQLRKAGRP